MTDSKTSNYNPYQVSSGNSPFAKNDVQGQLPNTPHDPQSANHQVTPTSSFGQPVQPSHVSNTTPLSSGSVSVSPPFVGSSSVVTPSVDTNPPGNESTGAPLDMPQSSVSPQSTSYSSPAFEDNFQQAPVENPISQETPDVQSMPAATPPQPMPQPTGSIPQDSMSSIQKPVRKNKIALLVGMFVVITLVVTMVAYFFMTRDNEVDSEVVPEEASTVDEVTPQTREQIAYPTTNAISLITTLISQDSFSLRGENTITNLTGCVYTEMLDYKSQGENVYKNSTLSFPDTAAEEACEFEDSLDVYEELYVVADGAFMRTSIDSELELVESLEQGGRLTGSDHIRSIFPFPTLLTVTDAYVISETETEVNATYSAGEQSGVYTLVVVDNKIMDIEYDLENTNQKWSGKISVDYTAPLIVLPSATTSS